MKTENKSEKAVMCTGVESYLMETTPCVNGSVDRETITWLYSMKQNTATIHVKSSNSLLQHLPDRNFFSTFILLSFCRLY